MSTVMTISNGITPTLPKLSSTISLTEYKILTYIEYPQTIQEIQEALIQKIESEEI